MPFNPNLGPQVPQARINTPFIGQGPVILQQENGTPRIEVDFPLVGCDSVLPNTVQIEVYGPDGLLDFRYTTVVASPNLRRSFPSALTTDIGQVTQTAQRLKLFANITDVLVDGSTIDLKYTNKCGQQRHLKEIARFYTSIVGAIKQGAPDVSVTNWSAFICPINFCQTECQPTFYVNGTAVGYLDPQGTFVIVNESYFGRATTDYLELSGSEYSGAARVGIKFEPGLDPSSVVELKICDDRIRLNDCNVCCAYAADTSGLEFNVVSIDSVMVDGINILLEPITGVFANEAAIAAELNALGVATFVGVSGSLSVAAFASILESITVTDDVGAKTLTFTRNCS